MRRITQTMAATDIRRQCEAGSQGLEYLYLELQRLGFEGDDAEDVLDTAGITATVVDVDGRFVALAVMGEVPQ